MFIFNNDMFLCYRNPSENFSDPLFDIKARNCEAVAKKCKDVFEEINKENQATEKLKIYFSQDKWIDNYMAQKSIDENVGKARFLVIFVFSGFTKGFLNADRTVNEDSSTAKEFVCAEKARQNNGLTIVTVNIDKETFSQEDKDNIEKLLKAKGVYQEYEDGSNSITYFTNSCRLKYETSVALKDDNYARKQCDLMYREVAEKKKEQEKVKKKQEEEEKAKRERKEAERKRREERIRLLQQVLQIKSKQDNTVGNLEDFVYQIAKNELTIVKYVGNSTKVVIPESVTGIGSSAFSGCNSLTSVVIPSGVTSIGNNAFSGCSSLTSVVIPSGVTSIGNNVFLGCSSLRSIEIPRSVTRIGSSAFSGCSSLTSVVIPSGVTIIGKNVFLGCSSLRSIEIPSRVTSIGARAFLGCSSLTSIEIPSSVTRMGNSAFSGCSILTIYCEAQNKPRWWYSYWNDNNRPVVWNCKNNEIATDGSIYYLANNVIRYVLQDGQAKIAEQYMSLSNAVIIPNEITYKDITYNVTRVGSFVFAGSALTSIEIPSSVTNIENNAFGGCGKLTNVIFKGNSQLRKISKEAFFNCRKLTSVVIPSGVTSIGSWAFSRCSSLENLTVDPNNTKYMSEGNCVIERTTNTLIVGCKNSVIPNYVTSISYDAFYGCSSMTSIVIPSSVTSIGENVFSGCSNLTIYCEAESKPTGWHDDWNHSNRPVVWGYKKG